MIRKMYSVFDCKAEVYGPLFPALTNGDALRFFSDTVLKDGTPLNTHPDHYTLFFIGDFDTSTGKIECPTVLQPLANGQEFVLTTVKGADHVKDAAS